MMKRIFAILLFTLCASLAAFAQDSTPTFAQNAGVSKNNASDSLKDSQPQVFKQIESNLAESLKAHAMQDSSPYARRLIRAAADPSSAVEGQLYANSVSHLPKFYNGSSWLTIQTTATTPGGSNGQLQINNSGAFGGITLAGDCTFASPNITCTKSNGSSFGNNAFTSTPFVPQTTTVNGHALSANVSVTASDINLGSVTNDTQTKAAIVPNTAPGAGQDLVGNAGGTAYAPVAMSGDCTRNSTGAITCPKTNGVSFAPSATTDATNANNISSGILGSSQGGTGVNNAGRTLTINTNSGTLAFAASKTLTINNSLTLAGTDATTMTFPSTSATLGRTDAANSFTGTQTFTGQIVSSIATGTAPLSVTSTTPVINLTTIPLTYNTSGTQQVNVHVVIGSVALVAGSATVTLTGSSLFTGVSTYFCVANDNSGANAVQVGISSGSSFAVVGTGTNTVKFICVGN